MKGWDPEGQIGPKNPLPDAVQITEPLPEKVFNEPTSEPREAPAPAPAPAAPAEDYAPQDPSYQQEGYPAEQAPTVF